MVGACPIADAVELAQHAAKAGAKAISTTAPGICKSRPAPPRPPAPLTPPTSTSLQHHCPCGPDKSTHSWHAYCFPGPRTPPALVAPYNWQTPILSSRTRTSRRACNAAWAWPSPAPHSLAHALSISWLRARAQTLHFHPSPLPSVSGKIRCPHTAALHVHLRRVTRSELTVCEFRIGFNSCVSSQSGV